MASQRPLAALLLAGACAGVRAITSEMQQVLDLHNVYRCMHDVPLFTWDDDIAANAQSYADDGVYAHSSESSRKIGGEPCGENLAWGMFSASSGVDSTKSWYSEIQFTDPYGTADSMSDSKDSREIDHYTQMVWSDSTKLGCGKGTATIYGNTGDFWVCQYGPAGNHVGQFSTKVKAPVKNAAECGGLSSDAPSGGGGGGGGKDDDNDDDNTDKLSAAIGTFAIGGAAGHLGDHSTLKLTAARVPAMLYNKMGTIGWTFLSMSGLLALGLVWLFVKYHPQQPSKTLIPEDNDAASSADEVFDQDG